MESQTCPICWHPYTDTRDCACGCNGRSCIDCDGPLKSYEGPFCEECERESDTEERGAA